MNNPLSIYTTIKENTMQEKLVPFNLEEAKKNPERVRYASGLAPRARPLFVEDIVVLRSHCDSETANAYGSAEWEYYLRLVAVPKTKRYKVMSDYRSRTEWPMLIGEQSWGGAASDGMRDAAHKVRDVSFDKTTGIITVTYDE